MVSHGCALSIIVPTRNEAPNIGALFSGLTAALGGSPGPWELIFVDDSDDATPRAIRELPSSSRARVRLLHREPGQRKGGLGGAVQEGFLNARGKVIAVMDGDLQHPPGVLPLLIAPILDGDADLVAGSRYGLRGSATGLDGLWRRVVSSSCRRLAYATVPGSRPLEDPLSGLFALRRSVVEGVTLRPDGYKILLEVAARGRWSRARNVAYVFAPRHAGRSKASLREGLVFLRHLARLVGRRGGTAAVVTPVRALSAPGRGADPLVSHAS